MARQRRFEILIALDSDTKGRAWMVEDRAVHPDLAIHRAPGIALDVGLAATAGQSHQDLFWMLAGAVKAALEETGQVSFD